MFFEPFHFQATVFVEAPMSIDNMNLPATLFSNTFNDINVVSNESSDNEGATEASFTTKDGRFNLMLKDGRWIFNHYGILDNEFLIISSQEEFCEIASNLLTQIMKLYGLKASRIALLQEGFISQEYSKDMNQLGEFLLRIPELQCGKEFEEWKWHIVSRETRNFGSVKADIINFISDISKGFYYFRTPTSAYFEPKVKVELDVNTRPEYAFDKYDSHQVYDFFKQAAVWHNELATSCANLLDKRE